MLAVVMSGADDNDSTAGWKLATDHLPRPVQRSGEEEPVRAFRELRDQRIPGRCRLAGLRQVGQTQRPGRACREVGMARTRPESRGPGSASLVSNQTTDGPRTSRS